MKVKFKGCAYLDFSDTYIAEKEVIVVGGTAKVCWNRPVIDNTYPHLVQFCKKRGRLNNPEDCLCIASAKCNDYEDTDHLVIFAVETFIY